MADLAECTREECSCFWLFFLALSNGKLMQCGSGLMKPFLLLLNILPIVTLDHVVQIVKYMACPIAKTFMLKTLGPRSGDQIESSAVVSPTILVYLRKIKK